MGVAVFILRLLGGISYIYYLRKRMNFPPDEYWLEMLERLCKKAGLQKSIELVESALVRTPMVVGHLKPMILFPIGIINRLTEQEVEAILAHELAHVMRHDYLFNILQSIIEALFYYHPAVWWMSAQIRDERESACDEIAIDLLGNSMNYAKALVVIQEMAFFPLTASLAFAGQNKNQFLMRMQRILNQPQNKSNIMEKLIATLIVLFTLIGLNLAQNTSPRYNVNNLEKGGQIIMGDGNMKPKGFWNAVIDNDEVCITFNNSEKQMVWVTNECFKKGEFSALPNQEGEFTLTRAAGTITFKGKFEENEGYGKQTFIANADFKKLLATKGIDDLTDEFMFNAFLANANQDYFEQIEKMGYKDLSTEDWRSLLVHRVSIAMIEDLSSTFKAKGYNTLSIEEVINMKIHGVDKSFVEQMNVSIKENLSPESILNAKIHGLQPDKMAELEKETPDNMTADDYMNFTIHGIDADYIKEIQSIAGKNLNNEDILSAKIHGITADFVNSFKVFNIKGLNFDNFLGFKIHGVTPDFITSFNNVGLKNMDAEEIMGLKIANVSPDFVVEMRKKGYNSANAQKYIDLKYESYVNYAEGFGKSFSFPTPPPAPPAPPSYPENFRLAKSGKFGLNKNGSEETWYCYDYKFTEKKGKIISAYFQGKKMSDAEIKEKKDEFQEMKEAIIENDKAAQENRIEAVRERQEAAREALLARQEALKERQAALLARQKELQHLSRSLSHGGGYSEGKGYMSDDEESKALSWFIKALIKDNYVAVGKKTDFSIDKNGAFIKGKALPEETFKSYKSNIERILGKPLSNNFKYIFKGKITGMNGDNIEMNGDFTIDTD
jgi:hypothetical protein